MPLAAAAVGARPQLVCEGSPWDMGAAQGQRLREGIRSVRRDLAELEIFRLTQPWWLPYGVYRGLAERRARRLLERPIRRDHPRAAERLGGLAAGAGLKLDSLILLNAFEALLSATQERCSIPSLGACSAVAVRGRRSAGGEPVVTRLFDYLPLAQPYFTLRESRPAGAHRSIDFTVAPLVGAVDGMNERGLCITYNYAYTLEEAKPSGPISFSISEALERCATVEEAASLIASRPRWGGGLLMLADAQGDIASLELSSTGSRLRRPAAGEDLLCHTNAFTTDEMRSVEVPPDALFDDRAPKALRGRRVHESAERRSARLRELLDGSECFSPEALAARLADHGTDGKPGDYTLCVHGSYWKTTACLQYFPRSRRMRWSFSTACEAKFAETGL